MAASGHAIYYQSLEQESILRLEQNQASSFGSRQHHELRLDTLEGAAATLNGNTYCGRILDAGLRTVSTFIWGVSNDIFFH